MAQNYDHLTSEAKTQLNLSSKDRIAFARQSVWIGYDTANQILDELDDLVNWPRTPRMPSKLIVGDTNNGKSMLIRQFLFSQQPYYEDPENEIGLNVPVIAIQAPPKPNESLLYSAILDELWAPYSSREPANKKLHRVITLLRNCKTKVLVIDEIHHLLAGSHSKQLEFLNIIKYLSNELQLSIVAVGIKDAVRAINVEPQLANRFTAHQLPRWKLDQNFLRLLATFETVLPLKKSSNLTSRELAPVIYDMTEGLIGEVSMLLGKAVKEAINSQSETITFQTLESLHWVAPSKRRDMAFKESL